MQDLQYLDASMSPANSHSIKTTLMCKITGPSSFKLHCRRKQGGGGGGGEGGRCLTSAVMHSFSLFEMHIDTNDQNDCASSLRCIQSNHRLQPDDSLGEIRLVPHVPSSSCVRKRLYIIVVIMFIVIIIISIVIIAISSIIISPVCACSRCPTTAALRVLWTAQTSCPTCASSALQVTTAHCVPCVSNKTAMTMRTAELVLGPANAADIMAPPLWPMLSALCLCCCSWTTQYVSPSGRIVKPGKAVATTQELRS